MKGLPSAETAAYSDICEDFEQRMTQQFAVTVELIRASLISNTTVNHMADISMSDMRNGVKVMIDNEPCAIIDSEFHKPGKGQAVKRVKLRSLRTGRVWERTYKHGDSLPAADILETRMQFLYYDGDSWHFMKTDGSYEQCACGPAQMSDAAQWLSPEDECNIILFNDEILTVEAPAMVELEVTETDPGVRGDTVSGGSKPAKLSTGASVRVPLFINIGDKLKIDTRKAQYISRA